MSFNVNIFAGFHPDPALRSYELIPETSFLFSFTIDDANDHRKWLFRLISHGPLKTQKYDRKKYIKTIYYHIDGCVHATTFILDSFAGLCDEIGIKLNAETARKIWNAMMESDEFEFLSDK